MAGTRPNAGPTANPITKKTMADAEMLKSQRSLIMVLGSIENTASARWVSVSPKEESYQRRKMGRLTRKRTTDRGMNTMKRKPTLRCVSPAMTRLGTAPTIEGIDEKLHTIASDTRNGLKSISSALHISIVRGAAISIVDTVSKKRLIPETKTRNVTNSLLWFPLV